MAKEQRFERVYTQGALQITEIWIDKETGVNYLFHASGNAGGLTRSTATESRSSPRC